MPQTIGSERWALSESHALVTVLSVVYVHRKTSDGGDIYLTRHGLPFADLLSPSNWHEPTWFAEQRVPLEGTSAVYRVPTREVNGRSIDLVVKNSRVGEDVPLDTRTIIEMLGAEFNSPWEEFALVSEMREGRQDTQEAGVRTQEPLAIYVPPEPMQMWQSGRSRYRINAIRARHPGIDLDILKEYKLVYRWIRGKNLLELLDALELAESEQTQILSESTRKARSDLATKGYVMADMKPAHVIIEEQEVIEVLQVARGEVESERRPAEQVRELIASGRYSVVDYELLKRTPEHEDAVRHRRRHTYLDDQRDRFVPTELPPHLSSIEIFNVPYVTGAVESTGGQLWVVGRNARLFDYFLPERWRKTPAWRLSERHAVQYTVTKDRIHLVWKESRVGDAPPADCPPERAAAIRARGYNSPFEAFALALEIGRLGIPTIYVRAIYMTGTRELEPPADPRRYQTHHEIVRRDGVPVLLADHSYITLRGYYNGPDDWVAGQRGQLQSPLGLPSAVRRGLIASDEPPRLLAGIQRRLWDAGFDATLLEPNDLILAMEPSGRPVCDETGHPLLRITSFELIYRR